MIYLVNINCDIVTMSNNLFYQHNMLYIEKFHIIYFINIICYKRNFSEEILLHSLVIVGMNVFLDN